MLPLARTSKSWDQLKFVARASRIVVGGQSPLYDSNFGGTSILRSRGTAKNESPTLCLNSIYN